MTAPQAVIFDIGNVLIRWDPEGFYDRTIGPDRRQALFAAVDLPGMNERIDAGAPFRATIMDCAGCHPDWATEIRMWHDNWIEMASPRIEGSITLLRRLRAKGVPVFSLTNFGADSFAYAQTQYDFLSEFDRDFVSGRLGLVKPDPRLYAMVEQGCGIAPEGLLFTDDRAENIAVARERGWGVHLFDGPAGWAARLVAEGLLTESEAAT
jgi:2-haloacid dehalogenase